MYNLFHHERSSMGSPGNFLDSFPGHGHHDHAVDPVTGEDVLVEDMTAAAPDEGSAQHQEEEHSSMFGYFFADAQELDGYSQEQFLNISNDIDEALPGGREGLTYENPEEAVSYNEVVTREVGGERGDDYITPSPYMTHGGDETVQDRWSSTPSTPSSSWFGGSDHEETSITEAPTPSLQPPVSKMKKARLIRKEKGRLQKLRRKHTRRDRKLKEKSRVRIPLRLFVPVMCSVFIKLQLHQLIHAMANSRAFGVHLIRPNEAMNSNDFF